jgi:hypothetical protein
MTDGVVATTARGWAGAGMTTLERAGLGIGSRIAVALPMFHGWARHVDAYRKPAALDWAGPPRRIGSSDRPEELK